MLLLLLICFFFYFFGFSLRKHLQDIAFNIQSEEVRGSWNSLAALFYSFCAFFYVYGNLFKWSLFLLIFLTFWLFSCYLLATRFPLKMFMNHFFFTLVLLFLVALDFLMFGQLLFTSILDVFLEHASFILIEDLKLLIFLIKILISNSMS